MNDAEAAVRALLEKHVVSSRSTRNGHLHTLDNGTRILVSFERRGHEPPWVKILGDLKRLGIQLNTAQKEAKKMALPVPASTPAPKPTPQAATNGVKPVVGLAPTSTTHRLVLEETSFVLELRPDQLHSMLRKEGVQVPDSATVSFTNNGYVRVSWSSKRESVES